MNTVRTVLLSGAFCFLPLVVFISCVAILSKEYKLWKALLACLLGKNKEIFFKAGAFKRNVVIIVFNAKIHFAV